MHVKHESPPYAQASVDLADLGGAVALTCRNQEPLGAYATIDRLNYLFISAGGVLDLTARRSSTDAASVSAASTFPVFDWHEREMRDTQGVALAGLPNERALFIADGVVPPALTAEGKGVTVIVVGPVHAGIIEPGRFTFSSGGETVIYLDAQLSYSRRGIERALEGVDAVDAAARVARVCAACSVSRSWAYARALEYLGGVTCDEPTEWARVVCAELERIYNHLFDLASSAAGAGYGYGQTRGLALKERVHRLCARAFGHRFAFDAIVPGGVRSGVLSAPQALQLQIEELRVDVQTYLEALFAKRSLMHRFDGAGYVDAETARAFGAVGPARRASGGTLDIRSYLPYGAYRSAPPVVYTERGGDVGARCRIKRMELGESFALIARALRELGSYGPPSAPALRPRRGSVTTVTEGPRGTESVSVECDRYGMLARIHIISASYRNWPIVLRAMEANIVPDFPLVNKSFNLCYACADR